MMVVQAGAAEQVVDPDYGRRALDTIRTTGTGALAEMRRVVAMLLDGDDPGAVAPGLETTGARSFASPSPEPVPGIAS